MRHKTSDNTEEEYLMTQWNRRRRSGNLKQQQAGRKAKQKGEMTEALFDHASAIYEAEGLIVSTPTYPEFVPLGQLKNGHTYGFYKRHSEADRIITLAGFGGKTCWIEIKAAKGKNQESLGERRGIHQFPQMYKSLRAGALAFYAVLWEGQKWDRPDEWRLYPLDHIDRIHENSLTFVREKGILIPSGNAIPEWYPVVKSYYESIQDSDGIQLSFDLEQFEAELAIKAGQSATTRDQANV